MKSKEKVFVNGKKINNYKKDREVEYPPVTEQLDEIIKWLDTQKNLPKGLEGIVNQCMDVKSKHKK